MIHRRRDSSATSTNKKRVSGREVPTFPALFDRCYFPRRSCIGMRVRVRSRVRIHVYVPICMSARVGRERANERANGRLAISTRSNIRVF